MQIKVAQVNAFTANSSGGNPAGVVLNNDNLTDAQMLAIAKKVNFSETAFISTSSTATRDVRFFTPTEEVDLCGHATIGTWSYLFQHDILPSGSYTQNTKAGVLKVEIHDDGVVYMEQNKAKFFDQMDISEISPILNIDTSNFNEHLKPQIVSTGLRDLLVPISSEEVLNNINPDFNAMTEMSKKYDIVGLHVFTPSINQPSVAAVRNFAPLFGINEESATGTSNGALLCYLREYNMLSPQDEYRIEQGKSMNCLSYIYGTFKENTVWVGGTTSTVREITLEV